MSWLAAVLGPLLPRHGALISPTYYRYTVHLQYNLEGMESSRLFGPIADYNPYACLGVLSSLICVLLSFQLDIDVETWVTSGCKHACKSTDKEFPIHFLVRPLLGS